jgi:hypothetical protein
LLDAACQYAMPPVITQDRHVQDCASLRAWPFPEGRTEELKRVGRCVEQAAAHGGIRVLPAGVMEADTAAALHADIFSLLRGRVFGGGSF